MHIKIKIMPELEQTDCPTCKHLERPDFFCDICNGIGSYTPKSQILRTELIGLLTWLHFNHAGETFDEQVDGYLKSTERHY